jgi:hypothetical protein
MIDTYWSTEAAAMASQHLSYGAISKLLMPL